MKSDRLPVAIIGGGFSGSMVAAQLARQGIDAVIVEPGTPGLGAAYSTGDPAHLLNVRAGSMSAWPDDPGHFARFAEEQGVEPHGFGERRLFGRYVQGILDGAGDCVTVLSDQVVAASPGDGGWSLRLADGSTARGSAVVLALGNQPPEPVGLWRQG